ncbi:MAG: hypothetical protein H0V89_12300, partial [Deltaproteobacteria bacterium]|nr:hypothetical protein [Deltaproteobacteria bacterium]
MIVGLALGALAAPGAPVTREALPAAPTDPSAWIFEGPEIPEFAIDVDAVAFESLMDAPETWVPAAFTWKGVRYEPVGLRVKGENSFQPVTDKPSLKVHGSGRSTTRRSPSTDLYGEALLARDAILAPVALDLNRGTAAYDVYAAQLDMLAFIADREAAIVDQVG